MEAGGGGRGDGNLRVMTIRVLLDLTAEVYGRKF